MNCRAMFQTAAAMAALAATFAVHASSTAADAQARFADYGRPGVWLVKHDDGTTRAALSRATPEDAYRPASSFKPLLALIALETGALSGADEVVPWDGREYPNFPQWQKAMALDEAMGSSSESYFRTLAQRIGRETLAQWVARVGYGNGVIGEDAGRAWVDGTLLITPAQQLDFMDRFRRGTLPFAPQHQAAVKASMAEGHVGDTALFGKTGTMLPRGSDAGVGWFAGWTEGADADAAFVLMVTLERFDGRVRRLQLVRELLSDSGLAVPSGHIDR